MEPAPAPAPAAAAPAAPAAAAPPAAAASMALPQERFVLRRSEEGGFGISIAENTAGCVAEPPPPGPRLSVRPPRAERQPR